MATFTLTFAPIFEVLINDGRMSLDELTRVLASKHPQRFRSLESVEWAIDNYADCLEIKESAVVFNRDAKKYSRIGMFERDIQIALHGSVPNMDGWQLYPFLNRENSPVCYVGVRWEEIPLDPNDEISNCPLSCDFRSEGTDSCFGGCGYTV